MIVSPPRTHADLIPQLSHQRRRRERRRLQIVAALAALLIAGGVLTLMVGQSTTPLHVVLRVLSGEDVPGASFTVGTLRLPRMTLAVLAGLSFGLGGAACQTLLRNPLASPDIIGITAGSGAAAVLGIVMLQWSGAAISVLAIVGGLGTALLIHALAWRDGLSGARLILIGIGIAAMLNSVTAYVLLQAPAWSLQEALRWLTGSVNGARLGQALPLLTALLTFGSLLLVRSRDIDALRLGDDKAAALGVRLGAVRLQVIIGIVGLISTATAAVGPIAFVSFLAGPIAAWIVGPGRPVLVPAALVGAVLVLGGDYAGQFLLPNRYPVGVVTGALGGPYLLYLIVRMNRTGRVA
ncbi:iron complex transport system permease protein [Loktanella atrilutea]|uniref:Iron complex transport system permease protein n=1 Tax=Loktanella atrilutea TaxID=366533 RepID=A0A1M4XJ59_LOKAT|nr:iron ABC transporter permease [Loktanella atrilutea]SHE93426.1 iron complex transport system permease protein [Loktanella atrilutea]